MLWEALKKTIPRSRRALIALVVMILSGLWTLNGLQALLVPPEANPGGSGWTFFAGLLIFLPAVTAFYYYQARDNEPKIYHDIETLDAARHTDKEPR